MGFFDDAIRQHLDLKRRHGADPREVAHLALEALGGQIEAEAGPRSSSNVPFDGAVIPAGSDVIDWADGRRIEARRAKAHEETVEIDMTTLVGSAGADNVRQHAYDWSADEIVADIANPASIFEWETPARVRLSKAA